MSLGKTGNLLERQAWEGPLCFCKFICFGTVGNSDHFWVVRGGLQWEGRTDREWGYSFLTRNYRLASSGGVDVVAGG